METDFREIFTLAARQALVMVESKGLEFSFDCEANPVHLLVTAAQFSGSLRRLLIATSEILRDGTLHMSALTYQKPCGQIEAMIQYCGVGRTVSSVQVLQTLRKLRFEGLPELQNCEGKFVKAQGQCPATGAPVAFKGIIGREFFLSTCLPSSTAPLKALSRLPGANNARAWLVASNITKANAWRRRFQRLGWIVHIFHGFSDIIHHLEQSHGFTLPKLVIAMANKSDQTDEMEVVATRLGDIAKLIYAVEVGSEVLRGDRNFNGYEVLVYPLSPATLEAFTEAAAEGDFSATTAPLPLDVIDIKYALIVDDDEVNAVIVKSMLESMGYVVQMVRDGIDAVNACRPRPPDFVVMDVEMPQMDGFQTTRTLRGIQAEGLLPPFPILGMTAEWSTERRSFALIAGMDECIAKPIDPQWLGLEVKRLCTFR